ncbi:substrate-binding periplasmic protein [Arsukibacterium perlucidum]|uniref:substrate-binding periplasmic protein n=1 Tax=Arsukibacterium perlucidum TaxID=368811 RepID=UPI0003668802|nr:transporter substrate-binding domain-containing protein [Arsukibacterium perlucidum]
MSVCLTFNVLASGDSQRWQIKAVTAISFPGLELLADGKLKPGLPFNYRTIIDCMENQLNADFVWQQFPTARLVHVAVQHHVDVIFPMGYTPERSKLLQPSDYLVQEQDYWAYFAHQPDWQNKQLNIAVKQSSPQAEWLAQQGYQSIHQVYDYKQLLPLLLAGRVDAISIPGAVAAEYQKGAIEGLALSGYYQREAGFYLNPSFAAEHLPLFNQAVRQCRHFAVLDLPG